MNRRQTIPKELRYTVEDFHQDFPDNDACLARVMEMRYPGGMAKCDPKIAQVRSANIITLLAHCLRLR